MMLSSCAASQLQRLTLEPAALLSQPPPDSRRAGPKPTPPPSPATSSVQLADLKTIATLGVGGFGRVTLVKSADERLFALKIMGKAHVRAMSQQEHVLSERRILLECRCDFIVRMHRTFRDARRVYMLMEYCPGGELWTTLRSWGHFDEPTARFYCAAALEAFEYLHERFIIYRDLKPENVMLDASGVPKLVDFGFAKRLDGPSCKTWTFCGTAEYVAPEVILNRGQDAGVDLWGLGVFAYELLTGQPPFASADPLHTYAAILRGVRVLGWPRHVSEAARAFVVKLCKREPSQRMGYGPGGASAVRADAWMCGFDFSGLKEHSLRPPIRPRLRHATDTQNFQRFPAAEEEGEVEEVLMEAWDEEF